MMYQQFMTNVIYIKVLQFQFYFYISYTVSLTANCNAPTCVSVCVCVHVRACKIVCKQADVTDVLIWMFSFGIGVHVDASVHFGCNFYM